ncbi:hypothetical protein BX616_003156 [Lobosporangium transversale]|nr:hypothetical protein BX616_003156 [Lobosporangium transversale]
MAPLTPSRRSSQPPPERNGSSKDYTHITPSRSRSALGTTSIPPRVDNLLLPGVIGTTVEGPKTPNRMRRLSNQLPNSSVNFHGISNNDSINSNTNKRNNNSKGSNGRTTSHVSQSASHEDMLYTTTTEAAATDLPTAKAYQQSHSIHNSNGMSSQYIDVEISNKGTSFAPFVDNNKDHVFFGTPQGNKYRKAFRPHDTPIAPSKRQSNNLYSRESAGHDLPSPHNYLIEDDYDVDDNDYTEGIRSNNAVREDNTLRLELSPHHRPPESFPEGVDISEDHDAFAREMNGHRENQYQELHYDRDQYDDQHHSHFVDGYNSKGLDADGGYDSPDNNNVYSNEDYDDGDQTLDIGGYEDEIYSYNRLRPNIYADPAIDDEDNSKYDTGVDAEMAELKREQEQLGFIKRIANLLRKQRDEYGWSTPKGKDKKQPIDDGSDSDMDKNLTSARVRKGFYRKQPRTRPTPVASRAMTPPLPVRRTITPAELRQARTPSPLPYSVTRRVLTPPATARPSLTPPSVSLMNEYVKKPNPFEVPIMRQLDSGIALTASQDSDEYDQARESHEWRRMKPATLSGERVPTRPKTETHFQDEQEVAYMSAESDADISKAYGISSSTTHHRYVNSGRNLRQPSQTRMGHKRIYPWHVLWRMLQDGFRQLRDLLYAAIETALFLFGLLLSWLYLIFGWPWRQRQAFWRTGEEWARAGVASGLLSPGTLFGVALMCIAVWGSHQLGYGISSSQGLGDCNNSNVTQSSGQTPYMRERVSDTWSKLSWRNSSLKDRSWLSWIPQFPSISQWIPSRPTGKKSGSASSRIQIPSEQIQSFEELESAVKWIQKTLVELGQADDQLSKELQSKFDSMSLLIQKKLSDLEQADEVLSKELRTKFDGISVWVSGVEHKLNRVSDRVDSLAQYVKDGRWIEQTVLEQIRDEIPKHLVVSRDLKTGELSIPSEFWNTARELFVTPEQVQKTIEDRISKLDMDPEDEHEQAPSSSSSSSGRWSWGSFRKSSKAKKGKIMSWDDFLQENERALSDFVEGHMFKVSRGEFLRLVRTEANMIWQGVEKNVMELLEKQGKLHGKEAPRRRIGFYGSSSTVSGNQDGRGNTGLTELEKELVSGLIDEALEKYSADAIAKPDYALFSAGGRIIPRLTSQDYHHTVAPTFWGNLGLKYFVKLPRREKPAQKAIEPDIHAGECWAMEGQQGQLGIRLARRIVVTEITIEHADPSVVLDMDSAPKEIEVWGLRGSEDAAPTATSHHASVVNNNDKNNDGELEIKNKRNNGNEGIKEQEQDSQEKKEENNEKEDLPWPGAILLTNVEYNAQGEGKHTKPKTRQTFSIPLSMQKWPFVGVVLRIKSNWGHPKYTCMYRVRVHGYEPNA